MGCCDYYCNFCMFSSFFGAVFLGWLTSVAHYDPLRLDIKYDGTDCESKGTCDQHYAVMSLGITAAFYLAFGLVILVTKIIFCIGGQKKNDFMENERKLMTTQEGALPPRVSDGVPPPQAGNPSLTNKELQLML